MTDRFQVTPAAYIVLRRGNQILLMRRANTGYADGMYSLPAGHLDGAESALQAGIREAKEEIGVTIAAADMKFLHVAHRLAEEGNHERVDFFFEATHYSGEPTNMEPDKCDDLAWFDSQNLPANIIPQVGRALQQIAAGQYYSDNF